MAKYLIDIYRVEYYREAVVVDASSEEEAVAKAKEEWEKEDYLYEQVTDLAYDSETQFIPSGLADEKDIKYCINIK